MRDTVFLYGFVGLMALNLMASFIYLIGMEQMMARVRRAFRHPQKPR